MLNIVLQIISMVLCVVGLLQVIIGSTGWEKPIRFYALFYFGLFLFSGNVLAGLLLEGQPGDAVHFMLIVVSFFKVFFAYFVSFAVIRQILYRIDPDQKRIGLRRAVDGLFAFQLIVLSVFHFTGLSLRIDADNHTILRPWFYVLLAVWMLWVVFAAYLLVKYKKSIRPKSYFSLCALCVVSVIAVVLQVTVKYVYFATLATSIGAVILYILIISDRAQEQIESQREIDKLKTDVMLSQIQPHFLYNSLTTIKNLCRTDPPVAERAVDDFALYLRGNMDSLSAEAPIPFSKELDHTRAYLELEKLRFEDDLTIEERLTCTDFTLPALTLQPLVENAVRHGVRGTDDGRGTVTIATAEYPDRFEVTVTDDGADFDSHRTDRTDRRHIGIRNVRYRLKHLCNGELKIEPTAGHGTTATIVLPKQDT